MGEYEIRPFKVMERFYLVFDALTVRVSCRDVAGEPVSIWSWLA